MIRSLFPRIAAGWSGRSGLLAIVVGVALVACGTTSVTEAPPYATAIAACQGLGGSDWQVAVEIDRPAASALALVSGTAIGTCLANRDGAGFNSTSLGVSGAPTSSPAVLSYVTSQEAGNEALLVGRVAAGTTGVRVTFEGGPALDASVGNGLWLAWVSTRNRPTLIEALDRSGNTIARLSNSNGIEPGQ